jgi:hypothetical protein
MYDSYVDSLASSKHLQRPPDAEGALTGRIRTLSLEWRTTPTPTNSLFLEGRLRTGNTLAEVAILFSYGCHSEVPDKSVSKYRRTER